MRKDGRYVCFSKDLVLSHEIYLSAIYIYIRIDKGTFGYMMSPANVIKMSWGWIS